MKRLKARVGLVLVLCAAAGVAGGTTALAGCTDQVFADCFTNVEGATLKTLSRAEVLALPKFPGDKGGVIVDFPKDAPTYEYHSLSDCAQVRPDTPTEQASCAHALRACPPDEIGPLLRIWRRTVNGVTVTEPWTSHGLTCAADVAPGSA